MKNYFQPKARAARSMFVRAMLDNIELQERLYEQMNKLDGRTTAAKDVHAKIKNAEADIELMRTKLNALP